MNQADKKPLLLGMEVLLMRDLLEDSEATIVHHEASILGGRYQIILLKKEIKPASLSNGQEPVFPEGLRTA